MEGVIFDCPGPWEHWLPKGLRRGETAEALCGRRWDLAVLTPGGCRRTEAGWLACRVLLAPGDCPPEVLERLEADTVVSYGLSHRDSLTLSSLTAPVLCVQRALPRPDGAVIEPQEFPLPPLPAPVEKLLPLLGAKLLLMPLTKGPSPW